MEIAINRAALVESAAIRTGEVVVERGIVALLVLFPASVTLRECSTSLPPRVQSANAHALLVMVLLQVLLERVGQRQCVDAVVRGAAANGSAADVLQAKGLYPVDGVREQRLEEHAGVGILVVLEEAGDGGRVEDARVVHIEAKVVVPLLNSRV